MKEHVLAKPCVLLTFIFKGQNLKVMLVFCAIAGDVWDIMFWDIIRTNKNWVTGNRTRWRYLLECGLVFHGRREIL